nr:ribosomal protein L13 [Erythrotrichia foliiformis]
MNKTIFPKISNGSKFSNNWYIIDAEQQYLGRLATEVANRLRGKHKNMYTPHADIGDQIIIINASKINVTGKKLIQKKYYRHSGRPGGMKVETLESLQNRIPTRVVEKAVKGMLPKGPLGRTLFKKLKVYSGAKHPHEAQKPEIINFVN